MAATMSRMSPPPIIPLGHQPSKVSIAGSDVTYQTFYTVDQWDASTAPTPRPRYSTPVQSFTPRPQFSTPAQSFSPPRPKFSTPVETFSTPVEAFAAPVVPVWELDTESSVKPAPARQDSGYESIPRASTSSRRRPSDSPGARDRIIDGPASSAPNLRARRSIRRTGKTIITQQTARTSGSSLYLDRANTMSQTRFNPAQTSQSTTFFHFPSTGPSLVRPHTAGAVASHEGEHDKEEVEETPTPPPQTQHYWTSDHTRRREYAAIDAASRGFRGWMLRHLVPDCMIPNNQRRVGFDDDGGSVRRYRIELEDEKEGATVTETHRRRFRKWVHESLCV
ncbi:hypothetical protein MKZ38_008678 [Zalerion maritima]|uniref:Uncharacterized protein n=1 Tax=Zalerion maritima TaxID=339359 RepID=A0AAD5WP14_9PEZI|nr:hypothetical protein MKZ38_008678 [Zalerion maritima]